MGNIIWSKPTSVARSAAFVPRSEPSSITLSSTDLRPAEPSGTVRNRQSDTSPARPAGRTPAVLTRLTEAAPPFPERTGPSPTCCRVGARRRLLDPSASAAPFVWPRRAPACMRTRQRHHLLPRNPHGRKAPNHTRSPPSLCGLCPPPWGVRARHRHTAHASISHVLPPAPRQLATQQNRAKTCSRETVAPAVDPSRKNLGKYLARIASAGRPCQCQAAVRVSDPRWIYEHTYGRREGLRIMHASVSARDVSVDVRGAGGKLSSGVFRSGSQTQSITPLIIAL
jgi:hypothetical protein